MEFKLAFAPPHNRAFIVGLSTSISPKLVVVSDRGDSLPPGMPVSFVSRHPHVVTVDSVGTIVAMAGGFTWIVASLGAVASPDSIPVTVYCRFDIAEFDPPQRTMRVGESFVPSILLWTCAGPKRDPDGVYWLAIESGIVDVDSATGRTVGRRPRSARVVAIGQPHNYAMGIIPVTVLPAP